ncbi:MAG TPA: TIR domain-containing protein [Fibrobacteria bacterium]|nr:TIR domain-containing protein [Fibrobacteria bacterium]
MDPDGLFQKHKRKIYVGYDLFVDGPYYEAFKRMSSSLYDIVRDTSMERELDGEDAEGFIRHVRDETMEDCACAVILCGARTHLDKFVDWEIKAALDRKLSLVGLVLPANPSDSAGQPLLPDRMQANFDGGFAVVCRWEELSSAKVDLSARIRFAMERPASLIENSLPLRLRNG